MSGPLVPESPTIRESERLALFDAVAEIFVTGDLEGRRAHLQRALQYGLRSLGGVAFHPTLRPGSERDVQRVEHAACGSARTHRSYPCIRSTSNP